MPIVSTVNQAASRALADGTYLQHLRRRPEAVMDVVALLTAPQYAGQACSVLTQLVRELPLDLHAKYTRMIGGQSTEMTPGEVGLSSPHLLKHMISLGLQVNTRIDNMGRTLLHALVSLWADAGPVPRLADRAMETLQVLLKSGANPNCKNATGHCPLYIALRLLQRSGGTDLRLICALLPGTTCMPLCAGLCADDLVKQMQRPAAEVTADLLKHCHRRQRSCGGGIATDAAATPLEPSPQLDLLLTAVQFRVPSVDSLLMLLPVVALDRYAEWVQAAVDYSPCGNDCRDSSLPKFHHPLSPSLVAKYKAALLADPGCIGLYSLLAASKNLRQAVVQDAACRAVLPTGIKAFLKKLGTSHELSSQAVHDISWLLCRMGSVFIVESAGVTDASRMTGAHPWLVPLADADYWRDILQLLSLKGVARDYSMLVQVLLPSLEEIVCCTTGGRLLRIMPEFLEALAGPSRGCLHLFNKQLRRLIKDVSGGRDVDSSNLRAVRGLCDIMAFARRLERLGPSGYIDEKVLKPVDGVSSQDLPGYVACMQARMHKPLAELRASELWAHMHRLHSMHVDAVPACISHASMGARSMTYMWMDIQRCLSVALNDSLPPCQSYVVAAQELQHYDDLLAAFSAEQAATSNDKSAKTDDFGYKQDADMRARHDHVAARRLMQSCSYCRRARADLEVAGMVPSLSSCSGCRVAAYCSRECQVAHWKAGHKHECKRMAAAGTGCDDGEAA